MKKFYISIKVLVVLVLLIGTKSVVAQCNGGKIYATTNLCATGFATLKLTGNTTAGVTYQWQFSNDGGLNFNNINGATADTFKMNPSLLQRQYRCQLICPTGSAFSSIFIMDFSERVLEVKSKICSTIAGGNDSVVLWAKKTTPLEDSGSVKNYRWEVSSTNGVIWDLLANTTSDTMRVKFTSASKLYRVSFSLCPNTANDTTINELKVGLIPVSLLLKDKDCVNDSATITFKDLDFTLADKLNFNWYTSTKTTSESLLPSHDTIIRMKGDNIIRYYRASLKLCTTPFVSIDSAFTNPYIYWPKLGKLTATMSCPSEVVSIDYENRDSSRMSVFTQWRRDTGKMVVNPSTLFLAPVDSELYQTKLINNVYTHYKVYSKFCNISTNILDSTNIDTVFLDVNGGQLLATADVCPSDSVKLSLNNYSFKSTFPLLQRWEIFREGTYGFEDYFQSPLTDTTIKFRINNGTTLYKKSYTLCSDFYSTRYSSTIASTFLPNLANIDSINCGSTSTVKVKNDTIKIKDVNQTITRTGPLSYQWYKSTNKIVYTIIIGATSQNLTIAPGTTNLFYKRIMKQCPTSILQDTSEPSYTSTPNPTFLNGKSTILSTGSCLNDSVKLGVDNNIFRAGQIPTYLWQVSDNDYNWKPIENSNANDSVSLAFVSTGYKYYRRLTYWCPSLIVDSTKSVQVIYKQQIPWCESFDNLLQFGKNVMYNCWRYEAPVCSGYSPTFATSKDASPIFSSPSAMMHHQPNNPNPPVSKTADGKLITPAFYLTRGKIYRFSFMHQETSQNICWDSLYVTWGKEPNACNISNKFGDNITKFNHDQWSKFWADFIPNDDGIYYFAINYREATPTTADIRFDDVCLIEVKSCKGEKPKTGSAFAPSKIIQRTTDPGNYDKNKVTHQYCLWDTIMITYNDNDYLDNFDYYGMKYQFYKKRFDKDWKINDTFFRPVPKAVAPEFECHVRNRTDYHVMNVMVTDTDTYYKIVATCEFDGKEYHSDSLLVNGTHSLPYCDDWEGVGNISQRQTTALPAGNMDTIGGRVPNFSNCPTCWASFPFFNSTPTPNIIPFYSVTLPFRNPLPAIPQLNPDAGYDGNDVVMNDEINLTRVPYLKRKLLVFPAVRMYKGRGYRISFRWTDNRRNDGSPFGTASQDFDSLYVVASKGNRSGGTIDSFPRTKIIGLLKKDIQSNILEQGKAKYQTFWVDYQPNDTGTYYIAIVGVANAGTATTNSTPYRFYMDYFCIDTLSIDDCSEKPKFINPLRIKVSPGGNVWPNYYGKSLWCVGNKVNIEIDFGAGALNNWKYGYKMYWERTTDPANLVWVPFADSTNGISYTLTFKYQNYRLRLVNSCGQDTIIGPFDVLPPGGNLCWSENFEGGQMPPCWDLYNDTRISVSNITNKFGHASYSGFNYLKHDFEPNANIALMSKLTHIPPGFGLKPGNYRFSFWYKDNGYSQAYDSLKVAWSYNRGTDASPLTNQLINTVKGDFVKNSRESKWRYYSAEFVAPFDSAYHIKVSDFNLSNKKVYYHHFDDYMLKEKQTHDMLVIAVDSPYRACGLNSNATLLAKVMNIGYSTESNVPVRVQVDNLPPVSTILAGNIAPNEIRDVYIPGVDLSVVGPRVVKVWTDLPTDYIGCKDDTFTTTIFHKELYPKPIDTGDTFCTCFPVTYVVNTTNKLANWYVNATDLFPFKVSDTMRIDALCRDTAFYVSANNTYTAFAEPHNFSSGTVTYFNAQNGIVFDNINPDTVVLKSFIVYAKTVGSGATLRLRQYGNILYTMPLMFPTIGRQTIKIGNGWKIAPGTDYELEYVPAATNPTELATFATLAYAYGIGSVIDVKAPINQVNPPNPTIGSKTGLNYLYFYHMEFVVPTCESERVKVNLRTKNPPVFAISDTDRVCTFPIFYIKAPKAPAGDAYIYNWKNPNNTINNTDSQIVDKTGMYRLYITNKNNCTSMAWDSIKLDSSSKFNLGNDTSFCNKSSHILDSKLDPQKNAIVWDNGMSGSKISIQNPGTYICTVYNIENFCKTEDTIVVTRKELPVVNVGNDRVFCGTSADLGELLPKDNMIYVWYNASNTAITMPVTSDGKYYVIGTDTVIKCSNVDTIVADLIPKPVFDLGDDKDVCGASVLIGPSSLTGNYNYLWSTTSTDKQVIISLPNKYYLTVTDAVNGCSSVDSINVKFKQVPVFTLGNDTALCASTYPLSAPAPFTSGVSYVWTGTKNVSSTSNTLNIDTSGTYTLKIYNGCYDYTDQINVILKKPANDAIDLLKDSAVGCKQVQLTATSNLVGNKIQWNINTSDNKNNSIVVNKSGSYSVSLTNECGVGTKSVLVRIDAPPVAAFNIVYPGCMDAGLVNTSTNGVEYLWDFGDGNTSVDFSPLHNYTNEGEYIVTLNVKNSCGTASITKKLNKRLKDCTSSIAANLQSLELTLFPNPAKDKATLIAYGVPNDKYHIAVRNILGQLVSISEVKVRDNMLKSDIDVSKFSNGEYLIEIYTEKESIVKKLQVVK